MQSISTITTALLILIGIHSISAQWMQLFDQNFDQFRTLSPQTPKKKSSTIPIIVMLKPKSGKSLTTDSTTDANIAADVEAEDTSVSRNNFNFNQLLQRFPGFIDGNTGDNNNNNNQPLIDTYETRQTASILPMPSNYIPQQNLMLQQMPHREDTIHWPTSDFEKQLNDKTISSIDSLLPQFAAISESNQKQQMSGSFGQNIDGIQSFEDAIKKFTSNLTNLEHSVSDGPLEDRVIVNPNQNSDANEETPSQPSTPSTTTRSTQNNGKSSTYLSNTAEQSTITTEESDNDSVDKEELSQATREDAEQPYNQEVVEELVHKPQPLTSNRQRIKAPVNNNGNDREIYKGFQPLNGNNDGNEWVPMKSKKSKKRPMKQQQQTQQLPQPQKLQQQQQQAMLTLNDLHKNHLFGLPQSQMHQHMQQQKQLQQPFPGLIRPQKFYAAYAPMMSSYQSAPQRPVPNIFKAAASSAQKFNNMNGVRGGVRGQASANGFHHFPSPYFAALEMQGNANKPQHTEPNKDEDEDEDMEQNDKHHRHHHHDMDEEKEDMKSEKDDHKTSDHRHHHKDMITEDKKEVGAPPVVDPNELLNQHLSCCHQLLGQHSPQHQLHHEIGGTPIEEDKYIQSLVEDVHPHHLHHHLNGHHHHQFRHHPHIKLAGGHHEPPCVHDEAVLPTHTQYYIPNFPPLPPKPVLPPPITRLHFKPNFSFYQKPPLLWG